MQYFASFQPFEIFEEFDGVPGTYIKSFLISDVINLNNWQATHEANTTNITSFLGRPGIHYFNSEGMRDHTSATSFEKSLQLQELYRAANIISVGCDIESHKCWQISKVTDADVAEKIKSGEIKWISPSIWPKENSVEIIMQTDGSELSRVHDYTGLHYAFVDEPAYGDDAEIKPFCDGTTKSCQEQLQKFDAAIDNVGPITEKKIIIPKKENTSKNKSYTSDKIKTTQPDLMATEEELRKELEDAKKALKATEEELEKIKKDEGAKKATDEEESEEKKSEGKKATDEEKEDEEKTALKARIESLEKVPIVKDIVSGQLSAGVITEDKVPTVTNQLMAASKLELEAIFNTQKSFEAKLNTISHSQSTPYMGSYSSDSSSFDASLEDIDDEKLLLEVSG